MNVPRRGFGTALCAGFVFGLAFIFCTAAGEGPASAAISGSAHDFSGDGVQDFRSGALGDADEFGSCSVCHLPHRGGDMTGLTTPFPPSGPGSYPSFLLWSRNLADEANYFDQYNTDPVYLSWPTLMCYDCHDSQSTAVETPVDPETTSWPVTSYYPPSGASGDPHDIALDGTGVGYYEMLDGSLPSGPAQTDETGGHYWKRSDLDIDPSGSPEVAQGEKLSCWFCHEPHDRGTQQVAGESQAMFRTQYWDGGSWVDFPAGNLAYGQTNGSLWSSYNTRAHSDETPDGNNHGRNLCSGCHGYADQGTPVVMYSASSYRLPAPPGIIGAHSTASTTACTDCHRHNKIVFSCDECHGFPPLNTSAHDPVTNPNGQSYAGGAGAHQRHLDGLGAAIFRCEICHGPSAGPGSGWHPNADSTASVVQTNINIMGETIYWETAGYPGGLTAAYNGVSGQGAGAPAVQPGYAFSAMGGGDQRCSGLACHGNSPNTVGALNWTDDMLDEGTGNFNAGGRDICTWCHDGTPATIDQGATYAPNVMGDGTNFGFEVNGHGLTSGQYDATTVGGGGGPAAANQDCDVCHDATYAAGAPVRTHFGAGADPRDDMRLRATINGGTVTAARGPDDACDACHQNGSGADGTDLPYHHNVGTGYTPLEDWTRGGARSDVPRLCRQCHEVHGSNWNGTGRNLHMIGKWIDDGNFTPDGGDGAYVDSNATDDVADITTADNAVVFTAFTGPNSFDEIDSVTPPDSAAQNADDICGTCHLHSGTAGAATNAGAHWGTLAFGGDMRETDCMQCHDHDFDDDYTTADAFAPSGCEGCHNVAQYDPDGGGPLPAAPNVMGPGNDPLGTGGTPKPYDNGTYGFNVNGHGSNGSALTPIGGYAPVIDLECTACHDVGDPPGTHNDGTLDGRTPDPANNNPFHLVAGFINTSPTNHYDVQVDFDDYCATTCHTGRDMRHGKDNNPVPNASEFGQHKSYPFPSNSPPPQMFYDVNLTYLDPAGLGDTPHYAPCISCHDPHGTGVVSPRSDNVNFMVIYRWKNPSTLCAKCHP